MANQLILNHKNKKMYKTSTVHSAPEVLLCVQVVTADLIKLLTVHVHDTVIVLCSSMLAFSRPVPFRCQWVFGKQIPKPVPAMEAGNAVVRMLRVCASHDGGRKFCAEDIESALWKLEIVGIVGKMA